MTVEDMLIEVHSQLGMPTDLDIYQSDGETVDISSPGAVRILKWLNRGYKRILMWRFPNGRIVRFRTVEKKKYFSSAFIEGSVAASSSNTVTLDASMAGVADRYVGWVVEVNGEKRKIMTNTAGRVCTLNKAWSTTPSAGDDYDLYKNFSMFVDSAAANASEHIALDPSDQILSVLRVTDMNTGSMLGRADRTVNFESSSIGSGIPSLFQDREDGVFFDVAINEARYFELRYNGFPAALSALTDEPAIPSQFHEGILLWAVWWGLRRYQEFNGAYSTKRDLEDLMSTALQQFDLSNERDDIGLYLGKDSGGRYGDIG